MPARMSAQVEGPSCFHDSNQTINMCQRRLGSALESLHAISHVDVHALQSPYFLLREYRYSVYGSLIMGASTYPLIHLPYSLTPVVVEVLRKIDLLEICCMRSCRGDYCMKEC